MRHDRTLQELPELVFKIRAYSKLHMSRSERAYVGERSSVEGS